MGTDTSNYLFLRGKIKEMKKGTDLVHWFAVYTKPRNEKKVYARLVEKGIETFLPCLLYTSDAADE